MAVLGSLHAWRQRPKDNFVLKAERLAKLADDIQPEGKLKRTADTKADTEKISLPRNPKLLELAKKLQREYPKEGTKQEIATDFCGGNETLREKHAPTTETVSRPAIVEGDSGHLADT